MGRGIGTRVIRLLTRFGLDRLGADAIFAVGIYDINPRSLGAFRNVGFRLFEVVPTNAPGKGGTVDHILVIDREGFTVEPAPDDRGHVTGPLIDGDSSIRC